ncbi:MAG: DUF3253 domain-containing protein [Verrucomicrobiota bacterium]
MDEAKIRRAIYGLARERGPDKSVCPSEVARKLSPMKWRALMPQVIGAAKRMASDREILITQKGQTVAPDVFKGAFRLKLPAPD